MVGLFSHPARSALAVIQERQRGGIELHRRELLTWAAVVVIVTVIGIVWEITALNTFAERAGEMQGMIASPRPLDYINYDYTPDGRHFAFWAFKLPLTVTGLLLLAAGVAGTVVFVRSGVGKRAWALWACITVCAVVVFSVTTYYYLIATNFFI